MLEGVKPTKSTKMVPRRCKNTTVFLQLCAILLMAPISKTRGQILIQNNPIELLFGNSSANGEGIEVNGEVVEVNGEGVELNGEVVEVQASGTPPWEPATVEFNAEEVEVHVSGHDSESIPPWEEHGDSRESHGEVDDHGEEGTHGEGHVEGHGDEHGDEHGDGLGDGHADGHADAHGDGHGDGHGGHQAYSVLFPWFIEALGLVVFFILTRFVHGIPYTAVMFVIGLFMGIGIVYGNVQDQLTQSTQSWVNIDSEVILLVFLPGLLFRDALGVNWHLFTVGFWQIMIFAFPMVLAGTYLTALVAFYLLPFDWPWMLCLTLGSILAATDPVAVAALLNEVGAPPRLKIHIGGESMFNDGAAIVFYNVFARMFLFGLDIGLGEQVSVGGGFELFFRMAFGGAAMGIAFAIFLILILYCLDQRLSVENNVVQVSATVTVAYLTFYIAEVVCGMSGVIAVVICGITTRAYGGAFINDDKMMESFWILLEHLLNTLLFALGGVVWGEIIANNTSTETFAGIDWGYLILLYIFVMLIRFFLMFGCYPLTSRIGLKTNWQETFFISYGGLRGAVGIALAISLHNQVWTNTDEGDPRRETTSEIFACVGGIAFLTLLINGPTAGPILIKLGLATASDTRKVVLKEYHKYLRCIMKKEYVKLMTDDRYSHCPHDIVINHLVVLNDMKYVEAEAACCTYRASIKELKRGKTYTDESEGSKATEETEEKVPKLIEMRHLFIQLLHKEYEKMLRDGSLDERDNGGFTFTTLINSLEFAKDDVNRGLPLDDWKYTHEVAVGKLFTGLIRTPYQQIWKNMINGETQYCRQRRLHIKRVLRTTAFLHAHREAQKEVQAEFIQDQEEPTEVHELKDVAQTVLAESEIEVKMAEGVLDSMPKHELELILAHHAVVVLLNITAKYVEEHMEAGMISEKEAQHYLEKIDHALHHAHTSTWEYDGGAYDGAGGDGNALEKNSRAKHINEMKEKADMTNIEVEQF